MSKFDYGSFYGGYDTFAVSMEKFSFAEAVDKYIEETGVVSGEEIAVCHAYVRHRAGRNEDGECCVGWWLEYKKHKRSCPVYAMHTVMKNEVVDKYDYSVIVVP